MSNDRNDDGSSSNTQASTTVETATQTVSRAKELVEAAQKQDAKAFIASSLDTAKSLSANDPTVKRIAEISKQAIETASHLNDPGKVLSGMGSMLGAQTPAGQLLGNAGKLVDLATPQPTRPNASGRRATKIPSVTGFGFGHTLFGVKKKEDEKPLPEVRYSFSVASEPSAEWSVLRVHAREGISELYEVTLDLVSDLDDPNALLDQSVTLEIKRGGLYRKLHGFVTEVDDRGTTDELQMICRVVVRPAMFALTLRSNCRVWVERTVVEIVSDVLREGLSPMGREFDVSTLAKESYLKRELCTQYNETDYDFVTRLLHSEGIAFTFVQGDRYEKLVLHDNVGAYKRLVTMDFRGRVPIVPANAETDEIESMQMYHQKKKVNHASVVKHDRDFTRPDVELLQQAKDKESRAGVRENFRANEDLVQSGYSDDAFARRLHDGAKRVRLHREELSSHSLVGRGTSNVTCMEPGFIATLGDAKRSQPEEKKLIVSVEWKGECPEVLRGRELLESAKLSGTPARFVNWFVTAAHDVLYRPALRVSPPRIVGTQTAIVVGPNAGVESEEQETHAVSHNSEIYTDRHGRVKLQLFWDRYGERNEKSYAWVRVGQLMAGGGWGAQFIPRIGMEVVVTFEDGRPDKPLIIGCVYNGNHPFPYPPDEKPTISALRTHSSPRGNEHNYNELRFEDAKGNEQIYLHAERDFDERVERNHSRTVDAYEAISVGASQDTTVTGDQSVTVKKNDRGGQGDQTVKVENDRDTTVIRQDRLLVKEMQRTEVQGMQMNIIGAGEMQPGIQITDVAFDREVHVGNENLVTGDVRNILRHKNTELVLEENKATFRSPEEITLVVGNSRLTLYPDRIEIGSPVVQVHGGVGAGGQPLSAVVLTNTAWISGTMGARVECGEETYMVLEPGQARMHSITVGLTNAFGATAQLYSKYVKLNS